MTLDDATAAQVRAADPRASTWLTANAGSGKTSVLTDRVARLLLEGVDPQKILCLTYTKTAAAEMQNRLFQRLGRWALMPDDALAAELAALGTEGVPGPETLRRGRTAFARALETPGGLKIQTIHSFCAALLRRYPLEAGVSPGFIEMDDRTATLARDRILDSLAEDEPELFDAFAASAGAGDLGPVTAELLGMRDRFPPDATDADIRSWFGLPPGYDETALLRSLFRPGDVALLDDLAAALAAGSTKDQRALGRLRPILGRPLDLDAIEVMEGFMLYGHKAAAPFGPKIDDFPTVPVRKRLDMDALNDLMSRVAAARQPRLALDAARRARALHRFARAVLDRYDSVKRAHGWLDFDDLILSAVRLLSDRAVAAWVLWRLDGGIDHILVDEAQDTSPAQWNVIRLLAEEFTAGEGVRPGTRRTIFVVGDPKQSIYSFQGADPAGFRDMRDHFRAGLEGIGDRLQALKLEYSFRSSAGLLSVVDRTFPAEAETALGGPLAHKAFFGAMPGRVDLWPAVPRTEKPEPGAWYDPIDIVAANDERVVLADRIATEIARMIREESVPAKKGGRRQVTPGDILVLVQRRSPLFHQIIRACKAREIPIAGADRLRIGGELAVKDLTALLSFLDTPEDDLSLAAVLRSPLFGWSEGDLYDLARPRPGGQYLWTALRAARDRHPATLAILDDLRGQTDFLRPFEILERILTRHDGRRRLLARLGPEAEDGIDALLAQALDHEAVAVPSLTGFLTWLTAEEVEIKRQLDSGGDRVRVMTVHGAKGLDSPIVFLPDTARVTIRDRGSLVMLPSRGPVWRGASGSRPEIVEEAAAAHRDAETEERLRLLYVAITRAESWLVVCAAGDVGGEGESWYRLVEGGLRAAGAAACNLPGGEGLRLATGSWEAGESSLPEGSVVAAPMRPPWLDAPVPPPRPRSAPVSPSLLGGAKVLDGGEGLSEEEAKRRGTRVHLLIETLPPLPRADWPSATRALLPDATEAERADCLAEATAVLTAPDLAPLFAPGTLAEVPVTGDLPGLGRVRGTIDRLVVGPDSVLAVDFKTNAAVPARPEETPEGLLRQLGAYRALLEQVYPDRRVDVAILWTRGATLMPLPHDMVRAALGRATAS